MKSYKKAICITILLLMFVIFIITDIVFNRHEEKKIKQIISPAEFIFEDGTEYSLPEYQVLDGFYSQRNKDLAKQLNISEDEAFILGNLGKYWAKNILQGRNIQKEGTDLIYYKFNYNTKLKKSPFCFINGKPSNMSAFQRQINSLRKGYYIILNLDDDNYFPVSEENSKKIKNYVVVRKNHVNNILKIRNKEKNFIPKAVKYNNIFKLGNIKIILSDSTTTIIPNRKCSSDICKEILTDINNAANSIDMAIYGYSSTPEIEKAIQNAISRGVKIRMVYDSDAKGNNIYPDTNRLVKIIKNTKSDQNSEEARYTMHDKFYIFDNKKVITGSANLSHTDMSGFNSNAIIVIDSKVIAQIYSNEFNQMYEGKFHNSKLSNDNKTNDDIEIYFSPQDKPVDNCIIKLIREAKQYIRISAFVITENRITTELINANKRGVDIKIIVDALNASTQHSKHKELRGANIKVKAENYAGKMHSKSIIIDDKYVILGSMNFSNSGNKRNDENLVVLKNKQAAKFYRTFFDYQWDRIADKWLKYTPRAEGKDSTGSCSDGIDNNYDGKTDSDDDACKSN